MSAPSSAIPRLVIAGTSSGVGKTTVVAGLIVALRRRGLRVQPFKCGPDYIDPSYHSRAAGRDCRNLDSWMLSDEAVLESFQRASAGADLALVEGVMGLFDGCDYEDERASAAQLAKLLRAPVLLVLDIARSARSAAATAHGFATFDPALPIGGCLLNYAGSARHAAGCTRAIQAAGGPPVLGWLPREESIRLPERHLGLVPGNEHTETATRLDAMADLITRHVDLDALQHLAASAGVLAPLPPAPARSTSTAVGPLLAVARDDAFAFYYPDNLDLLRAAGARIAFFSPLAGELPPADAAGVYLGGGYPELHAARLSAHTALWADLRARHARGAPIWAECGGFMVLTHALIDRDGHRWPMAGLVPGITRMHDRLASIGYRSAIAASDHLLADTAQALRGHEFRFSTWEDGNPALAAWTVNGTALGHAQGALLASYLHIHLGQDPRLAPRLVARLVPASHPSTTTS